MSGAENVYAMLCGALLLIIILGLIFWLHIAYTHKDKMLRHLSNCRIVRANEPTGFGVWGHFFMMAAISNVLRHPKPHIRRGDADAGDIENFPKKLKTKIIIQSITLDVSGVSLIAIWAIGKYMGWLN